MLTARARGAEGINTQVRRVDIRHFGFRQLRHHRHGTGGGVDTPPGFGRRNALDAMAAGFKFQPPIDAIAADLGNHFFKSAMFAFVGAHDFDPPAAGFGVAGVHAEEIPGEQRRFIAAGTSANFDKKRYVHRPDLSAAATPAAVVPALRFFSLASRSSSCAISRISGSSSIICAVSISSLHPAPVGIAAGNIAKLRIFARQRAETVPVGNGGGVAKQRLNFFMAFVQSFQFSNNRRLHRREFTPVFK